MPTTPADITSLLDEFSAAERDAEALVHGLSEDLGTRRVTPDSWSVAECLDHLATANRVYLAAMVEPAKRGREQRRMRQSPAEPGLIGRLLVSNLEPPPRWWTKLKAPRVIRPRVSPPLAESFAQFMDSQQAARNFLEQNADLDLAVIRFPNPLVRGIRFSLATGLHVIGAHDRRHLQQAWRVRRALTESAPLPPE